MSKKSLTLPSLKKIATYSPKKDKIIVMMNNIFKEFISLFLKYNDIIFIIEKYSGTDNKSLK